MTCLYSAFTDVHPPFTDMAQRNGSKQGIIEYKLKNSKQMEQLQTQDKRFWFGILLVLFGGALLLDNLNIIPEEVSDYLISWSSFFTLIGAYLIAARKKYEAGAIFIAIGVFLFVRDFYWWSWRELGQVFWPVVIIGVGISLILRRQNQNDYDFEKKNIDVIDDFAIFGGGKRTVESQNFQGGKVTAIFGGSDINLGPADLAPGRNVLDVFVLFGGTDIKVPIDWTVQVEVFSLLGGFTDSRTLTSVQVVPDPEKILIVKGFAMFGGGDIKIA